MPLEIPRLRRFFAIGAIVVVLMVSGAYFYARYRARNALQEVPGKIGLEIQQSAQGFTISKSEQGHTLFKVQASKAIQYRQGGKAELHDVAITLYGSDSSRYDQIYGETFDYDPASGDVVSKGEVQIDLQANPQGTMNPDQTAPKELKNPIHLKTTNLIFNQKTGDAHTDDAVEFHIPQANGSALGVHYTSKTGVLDLHSQVRVVLTGTTAATLTATHGTITKDPRLVVLDSAVLSNATDKSQAEVARFYLRADNTLDHVTATGNVQIETSGQQVTRTRSNQLDLFLTEDPHNPELKTAVLTGNVRSEVISEQPMQGEAGKAVVDFTGKNVVSKVHALEDVKLLQHQKKNAQNSGAQDVQLSSKAINFDLADGRRLRLAETLGPGEFTMRPVEAPAGQQTVITADKFDAKFDDLGQLASAHGAPHARIINSDPGQPDRVSTSEMLDATFHPGTGVETIVQQGNVEYLDKDRRAWGQRARYTTADQILTLTGSPRIEQGGMTTTAKTMRMNRSSGEAFAEGDVRSTYNDLKPQPGGGMLASSDPIHVTSRNMTALRGPAIAVYSGDARLWQNGDVIEAPSIEFDRDQRSVIAHDSAARRVSTVLIQSDKEGKVTPAVITSGKLTYKDDERRAHFEGGVVAKAQDATITCRVMDVFLKPREQAGPTAQASAGVAGAEKLDRIVATGQVVIVQPSRRGTGDRLVYTADEDKYVLTGGPPSIFDAERGKITGVSLTFFRTDDRVLVEGNEADPAVTHTRVAR